MHRPCHHARDMTLSPMVAMLLIIALAWPLQIRLSRYHCQRTSHNLLSWQSQMVTVSPIRQLNPPQKHNLYQITIGAGDV
jgi:hypothetical protein